MKAAGVKYDLVAYPGAVHSFTHWDAGSDNSKGAAYNKQADEKSWAAMKAFWAGLFAARTP
jgi:dienelactone hydrolase